MFGLKGVVITRRSAVIDYGFTVTDDSKTNDPRRVYFPPADYLTRDNQLQDVS